MMPFDNNFASVLWFQWQLCSTLVLLGCCHLSTYVLPFYLKCLCEFPTDKCHRWSYSVIGGYMFIHCSIMPFIHYNSHSIQAISLAWNVILCFDVTVHLAGAANRSYSENILNISCPFSLRVFFPFLCSRSRLLPPLLNVPGSNPIQRKKKKMQM